MTAAELEKRILKQDMWDTLQLPQEAIDLANRETAQGIPTAIAVDDDGRLYVIQSSGQGPYIIWEETPWGGQG
jgi:hypothetical protein